VIVHVVAVRSFDPLDLEVEVFRNSADAETWCDQLIRDGAEEENVFIFTCEVREDGGGGRPRDDSAQLVEITLPIALLAAVDDAARASKITRDAYIGDALRERLGLRPNLMRRRRAVQVLRDRLRGSGKWNAEEAVRAGRDSR